MNFANETQDDFEILEANLHGKEKDLFNAIKNTLIQEAQPLKPISYFLALLGLLDKCDSADAPAFLSLLKVFVGKLSKNTLYSQLPHLQNSISNLVNNSSECAGFSLISRKAISVLHACLAGVQLHIWTTKPTTGVPVDVRSILISLLTQSLHARPKIRKTAQTALVKLARNPPVPSLYHPATITILEHCIQNVRISTLHVLPFLYDLFPNIRSQISLNEKIHGLVFNIADILVELVKESKGDMVLTLWVFKVLNSIFNTETVKSPESECDSDNDDMVVENEDNMAPESTSLPLLESSTTQSFMHLSIKTIDPILKAVMSLKPHPNDASLLPLWISLITSMFYSLTTLIEKKQDSSNMDTSDSEKYCKVVYSQLFLKFWRSVFQMLSNKSCKKEILEAVTSNLCRLILECLPEQLLPSKMLSSIIENVSSSLENIIFRENWDRVLAICESFFQRLGKFPALVSPLLVVISTLRDSASYDDYPFKSGIDSALECASYFLNFEEFTRTVPLNLNSSDDSTKRPYLLALFHSALSRFTPKVQNEFGPANLNYFTTEMMPLFEALFKRARELKEKGMDHPSKLFHTLSLQTMSLFPLICSACPPDVSICYESLLQKLLIILDSTDDGASEFKIHIYCGLHFLAVKYKHLSSVFSPEDSMHEVCQQGLHMLTVFTNKLMTALCRLYTTPPPTVLEAKTKSQVLQALHASGQVPLEKCIEEYTSLAPDTTTTQFIYSLLKSLVTKMNAASSSDDALLRISVYLLMDLVCLMCGFIKVPEDLTGSVFTVLYTTQVNNLKSADSTIQKKAYKIITKLVSKLPHATKSHFAFIEECINVIVDPEVLQAAESGSKKYRMQITKNLVALAANIQHAEVPLYIPIMISEIILCIKETSEKARSAAFDTLCAIFRSCQERFSEYVMIVVAGLAGTTHMQTGTILCLSRLIFEFPDAFQEFLGTVVPTVLEFKEMKQRDIVSALLSFTKILVIQIEPAAISPFLEDLITCIMQQHFKIFKNKVRCILERMCRRFSTEAVQGFLTGDDVKILANIEKRKKYKKKLQKSHGKETKKSFGQVLNDSDDDEDIETGVHEHPARDRRTKEPMQSIIREDEDIVDFLDKTVISHVSTEKKVRKAGKGFKENEGKLVIASDEEDEGIIEETAVPEDFYREALKGEGSFKRLPDGRIKFDNKRKRDDEAEPTASSNAWGSKKQEKQGMDPNVKAKMMGAQYKAKRARGDVMKAGMPDPYAYIPLSGKYGKKGNEMKEVIKGVVKQTEAPKQSKKYANRGLKKGNKRHKK